jgi:outer membrane protein TolC
MKRNILLIGLSALLLLWSVAPAQQAAADANTLKLSLDDTIVRALKHNVSLQVAELSPQGSVLSVQAANEKYYPTLALNYRKQNSASASYSFLDVAGASNTTKTDNYSGQISQLTPIGGTFSLSLSDGVTDTTQKGNTINPKYSTQLSFSYSQPLLQNFGTTITNYTITVARMNLEMSEWTFYRTVQDTIYNATQAYWTLAYSIENLSVQRASLKLAQDFLDMTQRQVEIGQLAPMDAISAQSEVATREANILAAEAAVKSAEDQIKMLLAMTPEEEQASATILPVDQPKYELRTVELDQALATAMDKRPDLKIGKIGVKSSDLNLVYTKNQLLPSLNLTAGWQSPGVSGTQILYLGNPLFGTVIGTIPGGVSNALKDTFAFKYPNWNIGLTLNIYLSNVLSRANMALAQVGLKQAVLNLQNTQIQAVLEIRNAVRNLQTTYKQVQAFRSARDLAEKKLAAEQEKLRVGLSTNYVVLQYQRDLTTARVSELQAIINYNLAQAGLERSMGTSLDLRKIKIADMWQN